MEGRHAYSLNENEGKIKSFRRKKKALQLTDRGCLVAEVTTKPERHTRKADFKISESRFQRVQESMV